MSQSTSFFWYNLIDQWFVAEIGIPLVQKHTGLVHWAERTFRGFASVSSRGLRLEVLSKFSFLFFYFLTHRSPMRTFCIFLFWCWAWVYSTNHISAAHCVYTRTFFFFIFPFSFCILVFYLSFYLYKNVFTCISIFIF